MFELFVEGGVLGMSVLTVELICLLLAAWKAPAWVKHIGLFALATGAFYLLLGFYQMYGVIQEFGNVSPGLIAGGTRVSLIALMYSVLIFGVSLVIRMIQKPRI